MNATIEYLQRDNIDISILLENGELRYTGNDLPYLFLNDLAIKKVFNNE